VQHLLDLPQHRLLVLELQVQVLAELHAPELAMGDERRPARDPILA
jgi:hypothetical protein